MTTDGQRLLGQKN